MSEKSCSIWQQCVSPLIWIMELLVNYNKFGKATKEVSGLNDTRTKKKVKEFDWIDESKIR
jgi:hypothetical protein